MSAYNLASNLQTQEIYLDSQYATINNTSGGNSDVYFFLKAPISVPEDHDIVMRLDNFVCPISFFTITASNNQLIIGSTTYTIPIGNYNATTLTTQLSTLLSGFTVTFNSSTNKFTFSNTTTFTFSALSTCFTLLGFAPKASYVAVLTSGSYVLTSYYIINLAGTSLIYIDIPNITTSNISSKNNGASTTIVKSIVENVAYGSVLFYVNNTTSAVKIREKYLSFFHVRLLDDSYTVLNLNGQNFTLTLELFFYPNGQVVSNSSSLIDAVQQQEEMKQNLLKSAV